MEGWASDGCETTVPKNKCLWYNAYDLENDCVKVHVNMRSPKGQGKYVSYATSICRCSFPSRVGMTKLKAGRIAVGVSH